MGVFEIARCRCCFEHATLQSAGDRDIFCVKCSTCGMTGPESISESDAVERWNRLWLDLSIISVLEERKIQDAKWGGPDHDDTHPLEFWPQRIQDYAGWSRVMIGMGSLVKARNRLVQVAALAIAAVECIDRKIDREESAQ